MKALIQDRLKTILADISLGNYNNIDIHEKSNLDKQKITEILKDILEKSQIDPQPEDIDFEYYQYETFSEFQGRIEYDIINNNEKSDLTLIFEVENKNSNPKIWLYDIVVM